MPPAQSASTSQPTPPQPSEYGNQNNSLLLCEALGFSPQLLLDDVINIANNAVQDGVNGMEEFLTRWAEERVASLEASSNANSASQGAAVDATIHEVEQGLVAFQTLLEYHTDVAFDFFEAWCLRNIFMIPKDLPIILPHQEGLDLTVTAEEEQEAMDEVEELRKRLDGHRKLNRLLTRALRTSSRQLSTAEARLSKLSGLAAHAAPSDPDASTSASGLPKTTIDTLADLPPKFLNMYLQLSSLPPMDVPPAVSTSEPGKRAWETSKTGYMNWAIGRLLTTKGANAGIPGQGGAARGTVDRMESMAVSVGSDQDLRRALDAVGIMKRGLNVVDVSAMLDGDDGEQEGKEGQGEDSRMEIDD